MTDKHKSEQTNEHYQESEIDLNKLFQGIGNFIKQIWARILYSIIWIRRKTFDHIGLFIVLIFLGILVGFGSQKIGLPHYKASMLLYSSILRGQLVENIVIKLDHLCGESERTELASVLGISTEIAKKIKGFESIPFVSEEEIIQVELLREKLKDLGTSEEDINTVIDRIQIENKSMYEIVVRVYDTSIISALEEPIFNSFRRNPYISKRLEANRKDRELKIAKLKLEAQKLDSLKKVVYRNISNLSERTREGSNNVILADDNATNPLNVLREDLRLYDEILVNERQLELEPELEIVDGFITYNSPESIPPKLFLSYGIIIGILIGYLFIFLKAINSYLSKIEKEQLTESIE